jgi:hypothetical protein
VRRPGWAVAGLAAAVVLVIIVGGVQMKSALKPDHPRMAVSLAEDPFVPPAHIFRSHRTLSVESPASIKNTSCMSELNGRGNFVFNVRSYTSAADENHDGGGLNATQAVWQLPSAAAAVALAVEFRGDLWNCISESLDYSHKHLGVDGPFGEFFSDYQRGDTDAMLLVRNKNLLSVLSLPDSTEDANFTVAEIETMFAEMRTTLVSGPHQTVRHEIATDPFLHARDIPKIGNYEGFQRSSADAVDAQPSFPCLSAPGALGATGQRQQHFVSDGDARIVETVLLYPDPSAAYAAVGGIRQGFAKCPKTDPAGGTTTDRRPVRTGPLDGVSETLYASREDTSPTEGQTFYYELGVARSENVVVVLEWSSFGKPDGLPWVWPEGRLALAVNRAVSGRS